MKKKSIKLKQTCGACPEQYDAYHNGVQVAYLRLRHGTFIVEWGTDEIYRANPKGDGLFNSDERDFYLDDAKKAIKNYHNNKKSCQE